MRFVKEIDGKTYMRWQSGDYRIAYYKYQQEHPAKGYRTNPGYIAFYSGPHGCLTSQRVQTRDAARQLCIKHQRENSND